MQPVVAHVIERLLQLTVEASVETLHVVLETLALVIVLPGASAMTQPVLQCIMPLWRQHLDDRQVHEIILDLLSALLKQSNDDGDQHKTLALVLDHVVPHVNDVLPTLQSLHAIEVLTLLVQNEAACPLIVPVLFDPMLNLLLMTDDGSVLQHGGDCFKWFVTYAAPQLEQFTCKLPHTQGKFGRIRLRRIRLGRICRITIESPVLDTIQIGTNGVEGVMRVAAKLLSPAVSDSGAMAVGGLVTQVLLRFSTILPLETVHALLHAISTRLVAAQMPSLIQALITVFARLIHSFGVATVLDALDAHQALDFVVTTWLENQLDFYGTYAVKVTILALLKLWDAQDPRVLSLVVQGWTFYILPLYPRRVSWLND